MWTPNGLIALDALARRYGCRPSDLTAEADPYRAYCLDEACALAGNLHERESAEAAESTVTAADGRPIDLRTGAVVETRHGIPVIQGSVPFIGER